MKNRQSPAKDVAGKNKLWQKTPYANLIRYVPSGMYFCRIRVRGKLIRKSLKTDVLSVAKLRLSDKEKEHRQAAQHQLAIQRGRGQMTFDETLEIYHSRLNADPDLKSKTKAYYQQRIDSLLRTWPSLGKTNVRNISKQNCLDWAAKYKGSALAFNNTALVLRKVLDIAVESGVIYENTARHITRRAVRPKELHLPDNAEFIKFVQEIENAGGRFSKDCADLVRFLAYGGFRLGEAKNITWSDCDFEREEIVIRGDPEEGTKNSEIRRVPMIAEMRQLLEKLHQERPDDLPTARIMRVTQCELAMERAEKKVGIAHLTHHDLRHLFATRCIESGVDIPTVSRWLGHKDGGGLALKVYGHLRNQHSASMAKLVSFGPTNIVPMRRKRAA
ncbi:MAG TPA: site-specific integrase [Candidatus Saccharimonadales bacterium]|nr:site-specific integrase [Candidatus Saccharimonadales bacterium]